MKKKIISPLVLVVFFLLGFIMNDIVYEKNISFVSNANAHIDYNSIDDYLTNKEFRLAVQAIMRSDSYILDNAIQSVVSNCYASGGYVDVVGFADASGNIFANGYLNDLPVYC